jgi:hypothetical protein
MWDTVLSDFTYDSYEGIYDGSGGTDSQGINAINTGVSLINYTGHGSISSIVDKTNALLNMNAILNPALNGMTMPWVLPPTRGLDLVDIRMMSSMILCGIRFYQILPMIAMREYMMAVGEQIARESMLLIQALVLSTILDMVLYPV